MLELVITADDGNAGRAGPVVVLYAAGGPAHAGINVGTTTNTRAALRVEPAGDRLRWGGRLRRLPRSGSSGR